MSVWSHIFFLTCPPKFCLSPNPLKKTDTLTNFATIRPGPGPNLWGTRFHIWWVFELATSKLGYVHDFILTLIISEVREPFITNVLALSGVKVKPWT